MSRERTPIEHLFDGYTMGDEMHGYENTKHSGKNYQQVVLNPFASHVREVTAEGTQPVVLDLASGLGEAGDYLADQYDMSVIKLDISEDALQHSSGARVRGLATELPFINNAFDGIHFKDALVHVGNKKKLLKEMNRVLKPQGTAVIISQIVSNGLFRYQYQPAYYKYPISGEIRIFDEMDFIETAQIIHETYPDAQVDPPYFRCSEDEMIYKALQEGFSVRDIYEWQPPHDEPDWHPISTKRFVLTIQKNAQ